MPEKQHLTIDVLEAANRRIAWVFDTFPRIYVSYSAGKDSTVMLHMVAAEARRRGRRFAILMIDLEAQYAHTIEHAERCFDQYADCADHFWVSLPLRLRNAVSQYEPHWMCFEPGKERDWVRQPPERAVVDERYFPFFRRGMEFEEFVEAFGGWYAGNELTCCLVGIRADESLNRWRSIAGEKSRYEDKRYTTWKGGGLYNAYPIYDWKTEDIWTFHAVTGLPHNRIYDLMHQAGLTPSQMRICQPYGDDQRRGLWLFHLLEPETWAKVVARVNGANGGALYANEAGNIMGRIKISKPPGHTWKSFAQLLLESMPPKTKEHYDNKITVFLKWWEDRGYAYGIPDEADPKAEASRDAPSWRRICKALLRNDYWCKGLSFTQTKSASYSNYMKIMKKRRQQWGTF